MSLFFRYAAIAATLAIAGCSTAPVKTSLPNPQAQSDLTQQHQASIANIRNFNVGGRMGVQTDGRGVSGTIQWQHHDNKDDIALYSPMGGKMADVKSTDDKVTLISSDGKIYTADDAETLTQQTLGWRLPVTNLSDWVLGRPTQAPIEQSIFDASGKLTKLVQDGWEIEYQEYRAVDEHQLPNKLTLRNPKLYLKLVIERWDVSGKVQAEAQP